MRSYAPALALALIVASTSTGARDLPNYDASAVHVDERSSFVWAASPGTEAAAALAGLRPEQAARRHLAALDVQSATLAAVHDTGRGAIVVSFRRTIDGIEVFRDEVRVVMNRRLEPVAVSGWIPAALPRDKSGSLEFRLDAATAVAAALEDLLGKTLDLGALVPAGSVGGGFETFVLDPKVASALGVEMGTPCRTRKVFFRLPKGLEPAHYLELNVGPREGTDADYYSYVFSAVDGRLLFRNDLTVRDSYSYRVWADTTGLKAPFDGPQGTAPSPHPTGVPDGYQAPFVAPNLVTLESGPIGTGDPWLSPGATETTGNNADAYADVAAPDGLTAGDFRANTTSPGVFDRTYDTTLSPQVSQNQQKAAVTQLFYDVNFLHDWFYDSGFDEASGNAQDSNFGRGGLEGDAMRAEAQDYGGRNNANMSTPSDGARPRMQMYVFDARSASSVTVNAPPSIAGTYASGTAAFGPAGFTTTGAVVLVNDGSGTTSDACQTPFVNAAAVSGKIAFLDRGTCSFTIKVKNAQTNGAIGAIVANNTSGILNMTGSDGTIVIPSLLVSQADGNTIRANLGAGVNATLSRVAAPDRDGTIDNQIVAHEWGHYISNRLIGNGNGLGNSQGGSMGEGWGDFHALHLTVRPEDAAHPSNPNWSGVFSLAHYTMSGGTNNGYYFGIRRMPYSTDMTKNPLTFRHIEDGVPLPGGVPIASGASGVNNSEVHNSGEVWTTMLWECYAALLEDSARLTFDEARNRMRDYLVASYKLTPINPTFLEARDALLAAIYASDPADFLLCSAAFARRGAGLRAVAPDRYSDTHAGVVESYATGGDLTLVSATIDDDVLYCDDDGILDGGGERGHLTITLKNVGNAALNATTATISSTNPAVSFPAGTALAFPSSQPFATTTASVLVQLATAAGIQALDFTVSVSDPALAFPSTNFAVTHRGNLDDVPGQSATDDVESASPQWTASGSPMLDPWQRLEVTAFDHRWFGPDSGGTSDASLVSPPLLVAPTGSFSFTFRHRYSFEFSGAVNFDGGILELSTNGGGSWTDIGATASPGYNGTLTSGGTNPLNGRSAYVAVSPGYPSFGTVTVNLGTAYQGQTVLVRFRIGTDVGVGGPGWELDDIAFTNITNLPFGTLVADRALCVDNDADGVVDRDDCAPFDDTAFATPGPARSLTLSGKATTTLTWSNPLAPGGSGLRYDALRSASPSSFASAACLDSDGLDLTASDTGSPSSVYYYLIRSENVCGGNLGTRSNGVPRTGRNCP